MVDVATLGLAVKFDQVDRASGSLDKFSGAADRAEKSAQGMGKGAETAARKAAAANDNAARSADKAAAAYGKWHTVALRMASVLGTIAGTLATAAVFRYADAWSDMQSRVGAAVRDMEAAPELMQRMVDIANASYSPLDQTVEVYGRNVAVLRDLGRGATDAADFTEALNHALVITATRGERAASVQNALSKAMAVGKLQAEGLETVVANGGRVAEALAEQLGTTVSGLRAMASQGKITGAVIAEALIGNLETLREEAAEMPATIGDAFTRIRTNLTAFIGQMDKAAGSSEMVATALLSLADNIGRVVTYGATAVTMFGTYYAAAFAIAYMSTITLTGALTFLRAALIRTGIGALVIAAGELVYQFLRLVEAAGGFGEAMSLLKDVAVEAWDRIKLGAASLVASLDAGWQGMKATFLWNLHDMLAGFNQFIGQIAGALNSVFGTDLSTNPMGETLTDILSAGNDAKIASNASRKSAGALWDQATAPMQSIQAIRDLMNKTAEDADNAAGSAAKLGNEVDKAGAKAAAAYKKIVDGAQEFIEAQRLEAEVLGMSEQAANALRYEQDLLNEARRAGINLTPEDIHGFKALAEAMAEAEERTRVLTERFEFMKDLTKGFFTDFKNDLISNMSQGMSIWESAWRAMASAAERAIGKVVDKLLDDLLNAILEVNRAGSSGGGGGLFGLLGGLFGGVSPTSSLWRPNTTAGAFFTSGFSGGGYTGPGAASNPAGIVHAGEYVFSKQATDRLGVGYLDSLHNAAKGYMAGGLVSRIYAPANANLRGYQTGGFVPVPQFQGNSAAAQAPREVNFNMHVSVSGNGDKELESRLQKATEIQMNEALRSYDREVLPARVNQIANDPHAVG